MSMMYLDHVATSFPNPEAVYHAASVDKSDLRPTPQRPKMSPWRANTTRRIGKQLADFLNVPLVDQIPAEK